MARHLRRRPSRPAGLGCAPLFPRAFPSWRRHASASTLTGAPDGVPPKRASRARGQVRVRRSRSLHPLPQYGVASEEGRRLLPSTQDAFEELLEELAGRLGVSSLCQKRLRSSSTACAPLRSGLGRVSSSASIALRLEMEEDHRSGGSFAATPQLPQRPCLSWIVHPGRRLSTGCLEQCLAAGMLTRHSYPHQPVAWSRRIAVLLDEDPCSAQLAAECVGVQQLRAAPEDLGPPGRVRQIRAEGMRRSACLSVLYVRDQT